MRTFYCLLYFACLSIDFLSAAERDGKKQTICLNMIVKDESKVIRRGLASVKPLIDYWVIVDTGSKDGTQGIIKEFMKEIPGELHERGWKNFEHNRNQALDLAKGKADYILFIDADEILEYTPNFKLPNLDRDSYTSVILDAGSQYDRILMIKDGLDWKWVGVLHEYLSSPKAKNEAKLAGITKVSNREGARSADPQKYQKDARVLEEALKEQPNNSRYVFYLAQSYKDAGDYASSLKNYEKRIEMGGWEEELFYSKFQVARLQQQLKMSPEIFIKSYNAAFQYRPSRVEPLYYLAKYYRDKEDFKTAYRLAAIGMSIPFPKDVLFVEKWIYDYDMQLEGSVSAYWIGKYEECQKISNALLAKPNLPQHIRELVERNLGFANAKVVEEIANIALTSQETN